MAAGSPFEKEYIDERKRTDLASVLEHLNLPPAFIEFVRANQQTIKIVTVVSVVLVVAWSIYDSYSASRVEKSSSALYNALQLDENEKAFALEKVLSDYKGTPATVWAEVELAHNALRKEDFSGAIEKYKIIQESAGKANPIYPLVTYGMARSYEGMQNYSEALEEYEILSEIAGFQSIGAFGAGRIHEIEGRKDEAITIYEKFLSSLDVEQQNSPEKTILEERIARLKAIK